MYGEARSKGMKWNGMNLTFLKSVGGRCSCNFHMNAAFGFVDDEFVSRPGASMSVLLAPSFESIVSGKDKGQM